MNLRKLLLIGLFLVGNQANAGIEDIWKKNGMQNLLCTLAVVSGVESLYEYWNKDDVSKGDNSINRFASQAESAFLAAHVVATITGGVSTFNSSYFGGENYRSGAFSAMFAGTRWFYRFLKKESVYREDSKDIKLRKRASSFLYGAGASVSIMAAIGGLDYADRFAWRPANY